WEVFLSKNIFRRIHRSTIINLEYVEKIEKFFRRSFIVQLKNTKQPFIISQRYSTKLRVKNLF
ncbi:MAG: DNA-binding response regulator, partial [Ignavibacteria bacterium CG08_land_8_20_14_0_20_37_9]